MVGAGSRLEPALCRNGKAKLVCFEMDGSIQQTTAWDCAHADGGGQSAEMHARGLNTASPTWRQAEGRSSHAGDDIRPGGIHDPFYTWAPTWALTWAPVGSRTEPLDCHANGTVKWGSHTRQRRLLGLSQPPQQTIGMWEWTKRRTEKTEENTCIGESRSSTTSSPYHTMRTLGPWNVACSWR
jgi:hypothetical protein